MSTPNADERIQKYVTEKWGVRSIRSDAKYFVGNDDFPCYEVVTQGCGCCTDYLQTLDLDLVIKVAEVQVKLAQKQLDDLKELKAKEVK